MDTDAAVVGGGTDRRPPERLDLDQEAARSSLHLRGKGSTLGEGVVNLRDEQFRLSLTLLQRVEPAFYAVVA
ncbi:hypothetical protein [Jannaschia sp. R86511]|uniref:hypothetical protein n=1 Tax=Jannaschia sp. R86511 TaxID=3093853 RepID=UPI0036D39FB8